jgi:hypothetical protein
LSGTLLLVLLLHRGQLQLLHLLHLPLLPPEINVTFGVFGLQI